MDREINVYYLTVNKSSEERAAKKDRASISQGWKDERRELKNEILRLKGQVQKSTAKFNQIKEKELSLQLANRLMADIIKTYADRENSMFSTLRTMWMHYRSPEELVITAESVVDLDADE